MQQSTTTQSLSVHTVLARTLTRRSFQQSHGEETSYVENEFVCEKRFNVFHTQEAKEFHDGIYMVKENKLQVVEYPAYDKPITGRSGTITC